MLLFNYLSVGCLKLIKIKNDFFLSKHLSVSAFLIIYLLLFCASYSEGHNRFISGSFVFLVISAMYCVTRKTNHDWKYVIFKNYVQQFIQNLVSFGFYRYICYRFFLNFSSFILLTHTCPASLLTSW
uniref:SJCHGC05631 protein n=1 Tax=Schistosoma japonicum TaxID=6182 RepID=Q5DB70_SCHJA|nr:SJCHGC05631 protein [Schistosoma japonicum]